MSNHFNRREEEDKEMVEEQELVEEEEEQQQQDEELHEEDEKDEDVFDPSYEFAAPQFINFLETDTIDNSANIDEWFNHRRETGAKGDFKAFAPLHSTKPLTCPTPFTFATDLRVRKIEKKEFVVKKPSPKKFQAGQLNRKIFESAGDLGVPKVQKSTLTEPRSPLLMTKLRAKTRENPNSAVQPRIEAPNFQDILRKDDRKYTSYQPKLTEPKSPLLLTKLRSSVRSESKPHVVKPNVNPFKARSADVLYKSPFQPKPSTKPLTQINSNIVFHTEIRSEKRAEFDAEVNRKAELAAALNAERKNRYARVMKFNNTAGVNHHYF